MKTTEFNTVKTIKLINKDDLLKKVYESKNSNFDGNKLKKQAVNNNLADEAINTLKDIFESVILQKKSFVDQYNKIEEKDRIPKRYGKQQILKDVKAQGGEATETQKTGLLLADLKAMLGTLQQRGISDHYKGTSKLTRDNNRKIRKAIRAFEKDVRPILNQKR
jgi:hypothetical protein